ncbi:MAG: SDR family NAD(P)-dependent oxidoreductase [Chloroflexota bacterium]
MTLQGRVALITGGGSGIGRSSALRLARAGSDVAVLDLNLDGAKQTAAQVSTLGRRSVALEANVVNSVEVRAAAARVEQELGPVDILMNNAGLAWLVSFPDMTEEEWDRLLSVHVKGAFNCTKAVVDGMIARRWGRIINTASIAGLGGMGRSVAYATAKAGLIGFTKGLARELAPYGVTVNAVAPGFIDTPMTDTWPPELRAQRVASIPVGRVGLPEDIAEAVAYLASEEASYMTGQVVSPNGGSYM